MCAGYSLQAGHVWNKRAETCVQVVCLEAHPIRHRGTHYTVSCISIQRCLSGIREREYRVLKEYVIEYSHPCFLGWAQVEVSRSETLESGLAFIGYLKNITSMTYRLRNTRTGQTIIL